MNDLSRLNEAEAAVSQAAEQAANEVAWRYWDIRHSAMCNLVAIAMFHGGRSYETDVISRKKREIMTIVESIVADTESGQVPSGFGDPVRCQQALALKDAMEKAARAHAEEPARVAASEAKSFRAKARQPDGAHEGNDNG